MNERQNTELPVVYKNYVKTCRIFELAGGFILIGSILLNELLHLQARGFVIPAALIGGAILAIGGSSLLPHNQVKAFAGQLYQNPIREVAEAMLAALTAAKTVRLTPRHYTIVNNAIQNYGAMPDADPELAAQLSAAAEQYVRKGIRVCSPEERPVSNFVTAPASTINSFSSNVYVAPETSPESSPVLLPSALNTAVGVSSFAGTYSVRSISWISEVRMHPDAATRT